MLQISEIELYVSDLTTALRFWETGLELEVIERETSPASGFARLVFPAGDVTLRLIAPVDPWAEGEQPEHGARPGIGFDIVTDEFDTTLARLLEHGGRRLEEVETYDELRLVSVCDPDGNRFELIETPEDEFEESEDDES